MDRISNLPDEIICHICSFLSAKEAAFTKVLSKRWHNLFTIVPDLHFAGSVKDEESFTNFLDRVLSLPASSRVRNFSLSWSFDDKDTEVLPQYHDHINRCLRDVLKRGVMNLHLWIYGNERYWLPINEVFTCETIVKLSLGSGFAIEILPRNVFLPALKTLSLSYIRFFEFGRGRCAFKTLLDACPLLEVLTMSGVKWELWKWSRTVSSLSLKRLTIIRTQWQSFDDSDFKSISFDLPKLVYLYYSDYVPKQYLDVNLDSLIEAELHLCSEENHLWTDGDETRFQTVMNLLHGLKNVETLNLCTIHTAKMFYVFRETLPVFEKLSHLSVNFSDFCWWPMPILIKKSPNLKTLTIKGPLHYRGHYNLWGEACACECLQEYSFFSSSHLEVLKIKEYNDGNGAYYIEELIAMELILRNLSCLELVEVQSKQVKRN